MESNKELKDMLAALTKGLSNEELQLAHLQSDIAAVISEKRSAVGMSQKALADALHVSQALVSRWESGDCNFTLQTLVRIAEQLSIPIRSPYVSEMSPHYHIVQNIVPFPHAEAWNSNAYVPDDEYESLKEM